MSTIVTRAGKGSALTWAEGDANWTNLNTDKADLATTVEKTSSTGSAIIPSGTTAQQDLTPAFGYQRANSDTGEMEWWNGSAWSSMGGGATGGGSDEVFVLNSTIVTTDYTLPTGKNAHSVGPITVNGGVAVTVPGGQRWVVV